MTRDIILGKIVERIEDGKKFKCVEKCPPAEKQICEYSDHPFDSFRYGSTYDFHEFHKYIFSVAQNQGDVFRSTFPAVLPLKPIIDKLNSISNDWKGKNEPLEFFFNEMAEVIYTGKIDKKKQLSPDWLVEISRDRMIWLKHWANKAVELYGEDAGIEF